MKQSKRYHDFTKGPLFSRIILFSLPLIATTLLQHTFNTADSIIVGRWGGATPEASEIALAAVGSSTIFCSLFINLLMGLSIGVGICVAHNIGEGDQKKISRTVHTAAITAVLLGAAMMLIGIASSPALLRLAKTDPNIMKQATVYLRIYCLGLPANMLYNYCASVLRSAGDTMRPLWFLTAGGVANVLLNLLAVTVLHMGVAGVAIATVASHVLSCILIVIHMMRSEGPYKLELKKLAIDVSILKKIIFIGLPAGIQGTLASIAGIVVQAAINGFGAAAVAGAVAASSLETYLYNAQYSLHQASTTFVGQNVGAKNYERMKKCVYYCLILVTLIGISVGALLVIFGRPLLSLFTPDNPEALEAGTLRLRIICSTYFLCGIMEVFSGAIRGLGRSLEPTVIILLGFCGLRVLWIYTAFDALKTQASLYISYPISWVITALALLGYLILVYRKQRRTTLQIESGQVRF